MSLLIPATILLLAAAAAAVARNLVHAVLLLTLSFIALGVTFIVLGAEFAGFAQILVYAGAVSILIVFTILLTRPEDLENSARPLVRGGPFAGAGLALGVFAILLSAIFNSGVAQREQPPAMPIPVAQLGGALLHDFSGPLLIAGVLLTAALIGAAILALDEP